MPGGLPGGGAWAVLELTDTLVRVGETNQTESNPGIIGKGLREKIERDVRASTIFVTRLP